MNDTLSLTPGFSPVIAAGGTQNRFNGFLRPAKPFQRLAYRAVITTPLKRGVNEMAGVTARSSCNRSSAELHSAGSRICNPLAVGELDGFVVFYALPNAIRRYGKLQICATLPTGARRSRRFNVRIEQRVQLNFVASNHRTVKRRERRAPAALMENFLANPN
jgi:hypothetical protein